MPEGKYTEYGELKRIALGHAIEVALSSGNSLDDKDQIVAAAEDFYLFLIADI